MRPELAILESIYLHTDDLWEQCPLRLPPFAMFADYGVTTDDVAELLVELQAEYDFPIAEYPECIQDVVDLVMCRPLTRLSRQADTQAAAAYNFSTKPKPKQTILTKIKNLMKRLLPFLCLLLLCSCRKHDKDVTTTEVTFTCHSFDIQPVTRAALSSAALTDLYVWEGTTLIKHQKSIDTDFGSFTTTLTHGSHTLTFVASKADGQDWSSAQWSCSKVKDTFAKTLTFSVNGTTAGQSVDLARRIAQVCFMIQDAVPSNVKTMRITASNHLVIKSNLQAASPQTYEAIIDITDKRGTKNFSPIVNILPLSPDAEEDCSVMIEFLDADNTALYHYERTVPVLANRSTNIRGNYFTGSYNISISTEWLTALDVNLYE